MLTDLLITINLNLIHSFQIMIHYMSKCNILLIFMKEFVKYLILSLVE